LKKYEIVIPGVWRVVITSASGSEAEVEARKEIKRLASVYEASVEDTSPKSIESVYFDLSTRSVNRIL
jgi:hypothetical protein